MGLSCKVKVLPSSARTADDAAASLECDVAQIVKSLIFCTKQSQMPVLVLASGANRVDEKVISKLVAEKIVKADAKFTRDITGYAIGGIPPVGHKQTISHILIDEDLLTHEYLWAAAGTPNAVFGFHARDIEKMTNGKIVSIK